MGIEQDIEHADAVVNTILTGVEEDIKAVESLDIQTLIRAYLYARSSMSAVDKVAELRTELHKTRIERDQAKLEVLPPGWYWDTAPGEVRARNIDGVCFCSPPVGSQLRAIGVIPPAVQMGVGLRAKRLAIEPELQRWGIQLDGCEGEHFATLEAALEYGQKTAVHEFWAGPLLRARASEAGYKIDNLHDYINQLAGNGDRCGVTTSVFDARPGAQAILDVALNLMFGSDCWTIDTSDANRHEVPQKSSADEGGDKNADPPTCTGVGTASVS